MLKFDDYFLKIFKENNSRNLWVFECNKSLICSDKSVERCQLEVYYDGYVVYILDVVFLVVYVLYVMFSCDEKVCVKKWRDVDIWDFLQFI